ncbi:Prefoldin subunit 5, partial [Fragariocoptes setiger]
MSQEETLIQSIKELQSAKAKFNEALDAIESQRKLTPNKEMLVPLTPSMYVSGYLTEPETFLIDIGTKYLVEKDADGAVDYFKRKIKFIDERSEEFTKLTSQLKKSDK